jgi:hypothetical protein
MADASTTTAPIEASAPGEHIDDDDFATSDYDAESISSSSASLTSSIYQHAFENGRRVSGKLLKKELN